MNEQEAVLLLHDMYMTGKASGEGVSMVYLFAIKHAEALKGMNVHRIRERAGLPPGYDPELDKAINLATYVEVKRRWRN